MLALLQTVGEETAQFMLLIGGQRALPSDASPRLSKPAIVNEARAYLVHTRRENDDMLEETKVYKNEKGGRGGRRNIADFG